MENVKEINFQSSYRFLDTLLEECNKYVDLSKEERASKKEEISALVAKLDENYKSLNKELDEEIAKKLGKLKAEHELELENIEKERRESLENNDRNFNSKTAEERQSKTVLKEYEDAKKGIEIVAKRARMKENSNYEIQERDAKLLSLDLYNDYSLLVGLVKGKKNRIKDSIAAKIVETKATFNLKRTLTNKKTWANLVPLFMLIILIAVYFIARSITGYRGDLTDVINNGVFVAVVATGAVYIYSSGSFDMSLGPASLMCATIAAIVWNVTGNAFLAFIIAIGIGALLGVVNALLANVLDLPVMVMTLTMMNILNAIHAVILQTQGNQLQVKPGMEATTIIYATFLVCFFLLLWAIFNYTNMGRRNKFIGSNQVAAKFSGVSLMKTGIISFALSGIGLGICGFLFASYNSGSSFSTGTLLDTIGLNVVIAIVFGGMTTSGGPRSRVSCAVIGAFFCIFLDEIFKAIGLADARFLAKGIIFLVVSFFNMYNSRPKMLAR